MFKITNKEAVRNSKILVVFNSDLGAVIAAQKDSSLNYESEFHDTAALTES